jgi:hypothetical protein
MSGKRLRCLHGLGVILHQQGEAQRAQQLFTVWTTGVAKVDDSQTAKELNSLAIAYRYTMIMTRFASYSRKAYCWPNVAATRAVWQLCSPTWESWKSTLVRRPWPSIISNGLLSQTRLDQSRRAAAIAGAINALSELRK